MIDKWFLADIEHLLRIRKRVVILDPESEFGFLLPLLEHKGYSIFKTNPAFTEAWQTVKEELFLRYEAETNHKDANVIFYVTRHQKQLSFLFDYCFTHGCLDLSHPADWLKKKLFANTGLQVQMETPKLLTTCKQSVGQDITWWKKILQNLEELVNLEAELLPFLHDPENYLGSKDSDLRRMFEEKVCTLIKHPYLQKPPRTLAEEVVRHIFEGLLNNSISKELLRIYYHWVDSDNYRSSLVDYLSNYSISPFTDYTQAHPEHCFAQLDQKVLIDLSQNLRHSQVMAEKVAWIKKRTQSQKVKCFTPSWWQDVITLLEYNSKLLPVCNRFSEIVEFYFTHFAKVDRAIRRLYASFLQEETIIRPFQEYYERLNQELLEKWFEFANEYQSDQPGYLVSLLKKAKPGIAIIVGDGVRYEIADHVAICLQKKLKVEKQVLKSINKITNADIFICFVKFR